MKHLFFYGVLIGAIAPPPVQRLLAGLGPGSAATTRGVLYGIDDPAGAHPAMVAGDGIVRGMVHAAGSADIVALDRFEGADYRRAPVTATLADGQRIDADAYLWVRPIAGLAHIADGDFARWLRESGRPTFGA